jgi:hypothetical protein
MNQAPLVAMGECSQDLAAVLDRRCLRKHPRAVDALYNVPPCRQLEHQAQCLFLCVGRNSKKSAP